MTALAEVGKLLLIWLVVNAVSVALVFLWFSLRSHRDDKAAGIERGGQGR
jgi:hypothetical protein